MITPLHVNVKYAAHVADMHPHEAEKAARKDWRHRGAPKGFMLVQVTSPDALLKTVHDLSSSPVANIKALGE